jgi:hypothetical protein
VKGRSLGFNTPAIGKGEVGEIRPFLFDLSAGLVCHRIGYSHIADRHFRRSQKLKGVTSPKEAAMTRSKLSIKAVLVAGGLSIAALTGSLPAAAQEYTCPGGYVYDPSYGCTVPNYGYDYDYGYLPYGYYGGHRGFDHGFGHGMGAEGSIGDHGMGFGHSVGFAHPEGGGFGHGMAGGFHGGGFGGGHR